MRLTLEPPISQWPHAAAARPAWEAMRKFLDGVEESFKFGGDAAVEGRQVSSSKSRGGVIATGHQSWLWHPGILVKDIAANAAARSCGGIAVHVVVDHDTYPALELELPVIDGERLAVETLVLAPRAAAQNTTIPTGCQEPADPAVLRATLQEVRQRLGKKLAVDVEPLLAAIPDEPFPSLARQVSAITAAMAEPLTGPIPRFYTTDLHKLDSFRRFCQDLASDPRNCAAAYNEAAAALPEAGVPGLRIEARRVELPLWLLQWNQPRQRVFAQTRPGTDGGRLVDERDHELEPETWLAPRALALTAFLRGQCCDLFIHGTGGAIYDRVMGHWLEKWGQQTPAPHVVASADLYLDFPVPVSDERAVAQAQWKAHHLPHNLERHLPADGPAAQRKRELLDHMNDDRDRPRKAAAFAEIHQINAGLAARFGSAIAEAQAELNRALAGKANRAIAQKRDWFFGLYPAKQLRQLRAAVEAAAEVGARGQ